MLVIILVSRSFLKHFEVSMMSYKKYTLFSMSQLSDQQKFLIGHNNFLVSEVNESGDTNDRQVFKSNE